MKLGDEMGGHLVSGHIDAMAEIVKREDEGDAVRFTLRVPEHLARFIAQKGSVALDGTSLTVNRVTGNEFDVLLIRHSLEVTTWGDRKVGDKVNIEIQNSGGDATPFPRSYHVKKQGAGATSVDRGSTIL